MDVDLPSRAASNFLLLRFFQASPDHKRQAAQIQIPTEDSWNSLRIALHAKPRQVKVKAVGDESVGAEAILSVDYVDGSFEAQLRPTPRRGLRQISRSTS